MGTIDDIYETSRQIISMYHDLFYNEIYRKDLYEMKKKVAQIRSLVMKEYGMFTEFPMDQFLNYISGKSNTTLLYSEKVISRVNHKMRELYSYVIDGSWISSDELGISLIPRGMYFSFSDVVSSMVNIEIAKRLRQKICSVEIDNEGDYHFCSCLKERLRLFKADLLFANSTSEIIALTYHNSILAMPHIEKNGLEETIKKFSPDFSSDTFDKMLEEYAKGVIHRIGSVETLENNPDSVFDYLFYYTSAEVLITTFLGKKMLGNMLLFCDEVSTSNNQTSVNMVKQLIKTKLEH